MPENTCRTCRYWQQTHIAKALSAARCEEFGLCGKLSGLAFSDYASEDTVTADVCGNVLTSIGIFSPGNFFCAHWSGKQ